MGSYGKKRLILVQGKAPTHYTITLAPHKIIIWIISEKNKKTANNFWDVTTESNAGFPDKT